MGILEDLQTKMDTLIVSLNENTKARLAGGEGAAAGAAAEKPKTTRAAKPKDEPTAPKTDEATLVAKFEAIKGDGKDSDVMTALKKIIADAGFASLKELRQVPGKFDETFAALEAFEATLGDAPGADEDDL